MTGTAGESAETRALLAALDACGLAPASRDWQPTIVKPRLSTGEWEPVVRGRARPKNRDALIVQTPVGRMGRLEVHRRTVVRLATLPDVDISRAASIWVTHPALADELLDSGIDPERIEILPPMVPEVPNGSGGGGVLAVLPAHDISRCVQLIQALRELTDESPVRLLPTVHTESIAQVTATLPDAQLLGPITSELRFAALAGESDVVLCADPRDPFERRALLAASTGTAAVHLPRLSAAHVLGDDLAFDGSPSAIRAALSQSPEARSDRARVVHAACAPSAIAVRLPEMVERARRMSAGADTVAGVTI